MLNLQLIFCLDGLHEWETIHAPAIATWTQCKHCHKQQDESQCFCNKCIISSLRRTAQGM